MQNGVFMSAPLLITEWCPAALPSLVPRIWTQAEGNRRHLLVGNIHVWWLIAEQVSVCVCMLDHADFVLLCTVCTLGKSKMLTYNPVYIDSLKQDTGKEVCVCVCVCKRQRDTTSLRKLSKIFMVLEVPKQRPLVHLLKVRETDSSNKWCPRMDIPKKYLVCFHGDWSNGLVWTRKQVLDYILGFNVV